MRRIRICRIRVDQTRSHVPIGDAKRDEPRIAFIHHYPEIAILFVGAARPDRCIDSSQMQLHADHRDQLSQTVERLNLL